MATGDGPLEEKRDGLYILRDVFGTEVGLMWKSSYEQGALLYMLDRDHMGEC